MVLMAGVAAVLVVVAFLHVPIVHVFRYERLQPRERLGGISDIAEDSPDPEPPTAKQAGRLRSVFVPMCRTSVRSEADRRKLGFSGERVAKLCDCSVDAMIETRGEHDRREGFGNFGLIAGRDRAADRGELDDAHYLAIVAAAERACAAR